MFTGMHRFLPDAAAAGGRAGRRDRRSTTGRVASASPSTASATASVGALADLFAVRWMQRRWIARPGDRRTTRVRRRGTAAAGSSAPNPPRPRPPGARSASSSSCPASARATSGIPTSRATREVAREMLAERRLARAAPERRGLHPEAAAPVLADRASSGRARAGSTRSRRDFLRSSPRSPRSSCSSASRGASSVARAAWIAVARSSARCSEDPLAGARRADRHAAHRPGGLAFVLDSCAAGLEMPAAASTACSSSRRASRTLAKGPVGPASAAPRRIPALRPGRRASAASSRVAHRPRPPDLGRQSSSLARAGASRRRRPTSSRSLFKQNVHPLRRPLAPLPAVVLLPARLPVDFFPWLVASCPAALWSPGAARRRERPRLRLRASAGRSRRCCSSALTSQADGLHPAHVPGARAARRVACSPKCRASADRLRRWICPFGRRSSPGCSRSHPLGLPASRGREVAQAAVWSSSG